METTQETSSFTFSHRSPSLVRYMQNTATAEAVMQVGGRGAGGGAGEREGEEAVVQEVEQHLGAAVDARCLLSRLKRHHARVHESPMRYLPPLPACVLACEQEVERHLGAAVDEVEQHLGAAVDARCVLCRLKRHHARVHGSPMRYLPLLPACVLACEQEVERHLGAAVDASFCARGIRCADECGSGQLQSRLPVLLVLL
ncbi:unnamed protein product [Closterium sp. Naga37s-1]|nr:unnamed protein product [Closterium sp. Naga37s-1]